MKRLLPALVLLGLAGCGAKKPAVSPGSVTQALEVPRVIPEVDAGELFSKPLPGGIEARFTRREYTGYREGGFFVIDGGYQFFLTVTNRTAAPARVRCPKYLLGMGQKWTYYHKTEAPEPEFYYFIVVREGELRIPAGQDARVEVKECWYLGNTDYPPPAGPGMEPELRITVPAADSPYVRAALAFEGLKPPLDPWFDGLAYSLISEASTDKIQKLRICAWPWVGIKRLHETLEAAGIRPRQSLLFEDAANKRDCILEKLRAAGDAVTALRAIDTRSCAGDLEIALAFAAFVKPEADRKEKFWLPSLLGELKVRDPRILDRLFEFALRDGQEFSRVKAAIEGAKLGDPRCVPLLVQYSRNPDKADEEVAQLAQECTGTLVDLWEASGKFVRGGKWKESIDRFGGLDVPDLKAVPPDQLAELKAFLESGKNLRKK